MFSGKSEELIRRLRRAEIAGRRVLVVKPVIDDRFGVAHIVSHGGARMPASTVRSAEEIVSAARGADVVGVDEAQFFEPALVEVVQKLVWRGVRVVAAGLDRDFRGDPFGSMPTLLCIADALDKLQAVCHRCGGSATLTQRLVEGRPAPFSEATIQVGALGTYEARCSTCYEPGADRRLAAVG
jgi:thymidine kinase